MKTAAIIQARMASTRYPGKVLEEIAGIPMLQHIVERTRYAHEVDAIVIATTTNPEDHILLKRAREWQVIGFAGADHDVLKRYVAAATLVEADVIVRITADNPLFEPLFVDACVTALRREQADYCYVEGCILGTGVEAISVKALRREDSLATEPHQREHVNPYIMEHPDEFKIISVPAEKRFRMPEGVRLTVDTKADIKLVRRIYRRLFRGERIVSLGRTVELLKANPGWVGLNKDVFQKPLTSSELEETEAAEELEDEEAEAEEAEIEEAQEEEAPEEEAPAEPKVVVSPLRVLPTGVPKADKLDELMAEALSKEEEEAKLKEAAPTLDDVLAKVQEEPRKKPTGPNALDKLFGPAEKPPEPAEEAPAPAEKPPEPAEETPAPAEPEEPEVPPEPAQGTPAPAQLEEAEVPPQSAEPKEPEAPAEPKEPDAPEEPANP
jgi:spore coat polysaccharide biosynthesis protein SpsF